ncbi:MAG TPA: RdgB/HAM1 family non-canonical purine NTP pyrophosphatase [Wenzhouxiangella sp.]|nr:RdgB/HAM1 family non-canonical purine NTP pyrophosphatase [Wenzhouxiangella sp.]
MKTDHPDRLHEIVVASGNRGKLAELEEAFGPLGMTLRAQGELGVESAEETAPTFMENALIKARHAARATGLPALADDSGLVVHALGGQPGIHSARFAGPDASDDDNNRKLLDALQNVPAGRRAAFFHCSLVLLRHADDPAPLIAEGRWHGQILEQPRGERGFGYDPLFVDPATGTSAAELTLSEKGLVSHRGRALAALINFLKNPAGQAP